MFENKDESRTSLGELGEFGLINPLTQTFNNRAPLPPLVMMPL